LVNTVTGKTKRLKRPTIGDWVIVLIMLILIASCLLPVISVVARSLSYPGAIMRREVSFIPVGFHLDAYFDILRDTRFMWSLAWTAILTRLSADLRQPQGAQAHYRADYLHYVFPGRYHSHVRSFPGFEPA
jgi:ABC-type maltose transport system permease subunit